MQALASAIRAEMGAAISDVYRIAIRCGVDVRVGDVDRACVLGRTVIVRDVAEPEQRRESMWGVCFVLLRDALDRVPSDDEIGAFASELGHATR